MVTSPTLFQLILNGVYGNFLGRCNVVVRYLWTLSQEIMGSGDLR